MTIGGQASGEFLGGVYRRVHGTRKSRFGPLQRRREVLQTYRANDNEVDVAGRVLVAARDRTVDERNLYSVAMGGEMLAQDVHQADRLGHQTANFMKKGTIVVQLEIDAIAIFPTFEYSGIDQRRERRLKTGGRSIEALGQVTEVPGALSVCARRRQNLLRGPRQQRVEG